MGGGGGPRIESAPGFEDFVVARHARLLSLARGLVRHDADAEDLVQDVLARALARWPGVSAATDPAAYVNRMLVNAATSWWRRPARRERATASEHLPEALTADVNGQLADRDALLTALRRLPVRHAAVLVLRYYEGLPDAEIATALRMAPATVRSSAARGLAALRRSGALERAAGRTALRSPE